MSDTILALLTTLGRTTLWLTTVALLAALVLRIARPSWPAAHRAAWLLVLLVGWTFVRLPLAVPWYDADSAEPAATEQLAPTALPAVSQNETADVAPSTEPAAEIVSAPPREQRAEIEPSPAAWRIDWPLAALSVWALGIAALLAAWMVGYARFLRMLGSRALTDETSQAQWRELLTAAGIREQIPLCVAEALGPMLCRLPRGYLLVVPDRLWSALDACERRAILRHELAHYERGDVWKSLAARILALPHWFNPASWWAVRRFDEAAEWACDRAAAGDEEATEYARLLVRLGETASYAMLYGSAARGRPLAARIRRVLVGPTKEDSKMKKTLLVGMALFLFAASTVQLRLVAQQPSPNNNSPGKAAPAPEQELEEQNAPVVEGSGAGDAVRRGLEFLQAQRGKESNSAPTVSPYLNILRDSANDGKSPAEGPEPAADEAPYDPFSSQPVTKPADAAAAQKMVDEARGAYEAHVAAYEAETVPLPAVYDWSLRWMEAAERVAKSQRQRFAAAKEHLDRMRNLQKKISLLNQLGSRGADAKDLRAANYYVAEAERRLAEVEGAPAGASANAARGPDRVADEVQVVDLKIKIAEIKGQIGQSEVELETARQANAILQKVAATNAGSISRSELARRDGDQRKLQVELKNLNEQLSLREYKLKLLTERAGVKEPKTYERTPSKPKPATGTSQPDRAPRDTSHARYDGKDFDTWSEELKNELSPKRRAEAIRALASFGASGQGAKATELILSIASGYATDPRLYDSILIAAAFEAFQKIPVKDSFPVLALALKSEAESERLFALKIVTTIHANREEIPILLMPMLQDPQAAVRQAAATTLLGYDPNAPQLTQALREWMSSPDHTQVMFAVRAILGAGRTARVNSERPSVQQFLARIMPDLLALLDRDEPIKTDARKALLSMPASSLPALEEAEGSDNEVTRRHAEELLNEYSSKAVPRAVVPRPTVSPPDDTPSEK